MKATNNVKMNSWRIFQIMAEFVEGFEALGQINPSVSIFGSARLTKTDKNYKIAQNLSKKLSDAGFDIVSGGGSGIMEAANKGAFLGKSDSIGLNIVLPHEQKPNKYQDVSVNFKYFFARKVMFVHFATAYVYLPGGFGTMDELMEVLTLMQTGKIPKSPIILINKIFWQGLLNWFKKEFVTHKTINPQDLNLIQLVDNSQDALLIINEYYKNHQEKYIGTSMLDANKSL